MTTVVNDNTEIYMEIKDFNQAIVCTNKKSRLNLERILGSLT